MVLNPQKPKLTVLSTGAACADGSTACYGEWLLTSLRAVYEVNPEGSPVQRRDASDVLDLSQASSSHRACPALAGRQMPAEPAVHGSARLSTPAPCPPANSLMLTPLPTFPA